MESFEHHRSARGEELMRRMEKDGPLVLDLVDPRTQIFLARAAFPGDPAAMEKWLEDENGRGSLAERFGAYRDGKNRAASERKVDVHDEIALTDLLEAVRAHAPETYH